MRSKTRKKQDASTGVHVALDAIGSPVEVFGECLVNAKSHRLFSGYRGSHLSEYSQ
jgi:hypothetical protein